MSDYYEECWEDLGGCFWMVPVGIFVGFLALGVFCGCCISFCDCLDDDEVDETKKEDITNK